jgi:hypothetical protein
VRVSTKNIKHRERKKRRAKAHGEVLKILQEAGCRMDQLNIEGKALYQFVGDKCIMAQER